MRVRVRELINIGVLKMKYNGECTGNARGIHGSDME